MMQNLMHRHLSWMQSLRAGSLGKLLNQKSPQFKKNDVVMGKSDGNIISTVKESG